MDRAEGPPIRPALVAALLFVLALGVHARALDAPFVWDDRALILRSPLVTDAQPLAAYFHAPFWNERFVSDGVRAFFRPLVTLSFRLDYLAGGGSPFLFHATNIVLHAVVTVLLFAWVRRLGAAVMAAAGATALWALDPRLTESVSWISGRTDVLAGLLLMLAMLVWPGARATRREARAWGAAGLLLLALLAKEVALVGAAAIVAEEGLREGRVRPLARRTAPLFVTIAVYGVMRWRALHGIAQVDDGHLSAQWYLPLSTLGRYAWMVVDPRPSAQIGDVRHPLAGFAALGSVVLAAVAAGVSRVVATRDARRVGPVCVAVFGVALVLHVVPLPVNVVASDRYLYVPLVGLAALAALGVSDAPATARRPTGIAAGAVAVVFAWLTAARVDDWRDELRFWVLTSEQATSGDLIPLSELANVLYRAKEYERALPIYRLVAAQETGPEARRNLSNIAACLSMMGRYDEAIFLRRKLIADEPDNPRRHFDAGLVELHARRFEAARAEFLPALALAPDYDEARALLRTADEAELAWPAVSAAEGSVEVARWLVRVGARFEAQVAYLKVVAKPSVTAAEAIEAANYEVLDGDRKLAEVAVARSEQVAPGAELEGVERLLEAREEDAKRLEAEGGRIDALMKRFAGPD